MPRITGIGPRRHVGFKIVTIDREEHLMADSPNWYYSLSEMRLQDMPFGWLRANLYFFLDEEGFIK